MPSSIRETIVQAICDALNAPSVKPCTTWRTRVDAFGAEELPAMVIFALSEAVESQSTNTDLRTCTIRVEIMVKGEAPADALIDPLYVYLFATLDAADVALGSQGIRRMQETRVQFETESSYQDVTIAAVDFNVVYATRFGQPTVKVTG
jgi:hypothetical protein